MTSGERVEDCPHVFTGPVHNPAYRIGEYDLRVALRPCRGAPMPGTLMREGDVYSAIAHALDIDFPERRDVPAMIR